MKNQLVMRYPTTWHGQMWREGAPFGSGIIGGLVYGGILREHILINHALVWRGGLDKELPDISDKLPLVRKLLDEHKVKEADCLLTDTLNSLGYSGDISQPAFICDLNINTKSQEIFSHYRRTVDMEKAEVTVSWDEDHAHFKRSNFASRVNDMMFTRYSCEGGTFNTDIALQLHETETLGEHKQPPFTYENYCKDNMSYYASENVGIVHPGDFGAVSRVITDGTVTTSGQMLHVEGASDILIVTKTFYSTPRAEAFAQLTEELQNGHYDYDEELAAHVAIHAPLFNSVDFRIAEENENHSNEELLLNAYDEHASAELMEKLYAYGRYLFICSTNDTNSYPCHLTGLFNGSYQIFWAFNMYNINFEMIYWQALTGNLPSYLRLALDYTEAMVPDLRQNAKQIFGCRGIVINAVNGPDGGLEKCLARHIVNWTGGAAWFCQHFWDYYRFTEDIDYLKEHALPFMYETALFYEDFAVENADGYYDLYPSVSPENTASNVLRQYGYEVETCKNATMEFALMKELLTNLLRGSEITGMYPEKREKWKEMLSKIRPYQVNEDGAIREWMDPYYEDNYMHRHHSHIYPIFPGCEITKKDPLYPAFEMAEEKRMKVGISDQSSWSVLFMAGIASRMEKGDFAYKLLDTMTRTCVMNNFFTIHNDYRRIGPVAYNDFWWCPFQIDGNIGLPGIVNEMLMQSQFDDLYVLPALPAAWAHGSIRGLLARGNIHTDITWDEQGGSVTFHSDKPKDKLLRIGSGYVLEGNLTEMTVHIDGEQTIRFYKTK